MSFIYDGSFHPWANAKEPRGYPIPTVSKTTEPKMEKSKEKGGSCILDYLRSLKAVRVVQAPRGPSAQEGGSAGPKVRREKGTGRQEPPTEMGRQESVRTDSLSKAEPPTTSFAKPET